MMNDKKKTKPQTHRPLHILPSRTTKQKGHLRTKAKPQYPPKMEMPRKNGGQPLADSVNREGEDRLRLALDVAKLRIWDWDIPAHRVTWDGIREQAFGFSPGTFKGAYKAFFDAVHPSDREKVREAVTRALEEDTPYNQEYRIIRKNGDVRWLWSQGRTYRDRSGRKAHMIGVSQDITERKEKEERLQLTQFATEHGPDSAFWIEEDGRIIYVNDTACSVLGYSRKELLTMRVPDFNTHYTYETWPHQWERIKRAKRIIYEAHHRSKEGRIYPVEISATFLKFGGKEYVFANTRDITERRDAEESLRLTQFAVDRSSDTALWLLPDGRFFNVNNTACRTLGYTRDEFLKKSIFDISPGLSRKTWKAHWEEVKKAKQVIFESRHRTKKGLEIPVEISCNYLKFDEKEYTCAYARNIAARQQVEKVLQASEQKFRVLVQNSPDIIMNVARDGTIKFINQTLSEYKADEVLGTNVINYLSAEDGRRYIKKLREVFRAGEPESLELDAAGSTRWLTRLIPIKRDGKVESAMVIATDITERKRAHEALLLSNERFQALSRQLLEVQETERRNMARDLHDEIGQALTALIMNLHAAQRAPVPHSIQPNLKESVELADYLLSHVRNLSLELRPPVLDDLGLVAALGWYVKRQKERTGIEVEFTFDEEMIQLLPTTETACFRIVQEALTNIARHARAERITLILHRDKEALELTIRDNGVGFDVSSALARASRGESMGLLSMQERTQLLDGKITISSSRKHGTEIHVSIPLQPSSARR
jgi:PAS domain S-box-containing protein